MYRGDIWWANLPDPSDVGPGFRRPVLIVQADAFNRSQLSTVVACALSSNLRLAGARANMLVRADETGLAKDAVVNVSQLFTVDKSNLDAYIGRLSQQSLRCVEQGIRLLLDL